AAQRTAVLDELVGSEVVRLLTAPGELYPPWALVLRPDSVRPVVAADEVAAGPAQNRNAQVTRRVQDVFAEPVLVAQPRTFFVHTTIDAASEMLDEVAV